MAPADCSASATPHQRPSWSACNGLAKKMSGAAGQAGNRSVLGGGETRKLPDEARHRLRGAVLFSAFDVPVVLFRQDGVGGELGRGPDLYLQPDAEIGERA